MPYLLERNYSICGKPFEFQRNRNSKNISVKKVENSIRNVHRINQLYLPICLHERCLQHEIANHYRDVIRAKSKRLKHRRTKAMYRDRKKRRFSQPALHKENRLQALSKQYTLHVPTFTYPRCFISISSNIYRIF